MAPKLSKTRYWQMHGITRKGIAQADAAMPAMLEAVRLAGPLAKAVFDAAHFEVDILPLRTPEFQKKYAWVKP